MTDTATRRALLRTGALAVVGLAGCTGGVGDDADGEPTTRKTTGTATRERAGETTTTGTPAPPLVVDDVRVQSSFLYLTTPDSAGVAAPEGTQFVFADLRVTDSNASPPSRDEIALAVDDRRFDAVPDPGPVGSAYELLEQGRSYGSGEHSVGWVAFELPDPLDADEAALTYETDGRPYSTAFGDQAVEALADPPAELELVGVDAPESVADGESFDVSVAVENASERDGVFRASLNQTSPTYAPYPVELDVPSGERRGWSRSFGPLSRSGDEGTTFTFVSPSGNRELSVEVAPE